MMLEIANYVTEVRLYFCPFQEEVTVYLCIYFNFTKAVPTLCRNHVMKCKNICICNIVRAQVPSNGRKYQVHTKRKGAEFCSRVT